MRSAAEYVLLVFLPALSVSIGMRNPSMTAKGKITINQERCKGCHLCLDVCPNQNIAINPNHNGKGYQPARFLGKEHTGKKGCTGCAMCATVCPEVAIEVYHAK